MGVYDEERIETDEENRVYSDPGTCILCCHGFGIKDWLSRQSGDGVYVSPTPAPESVSVWDVFDEGEPGRGNESEESGTSGEQDTGEGESLSSAEPELEPTGNRAEPVAEPVIHDSDLIWSNDRYARCYDRKTDLWLVYEARIGKYIFGYRTAEDTAEVKIT
ncbi:MAG: hypothetical protein ACXQTY_01960 [Candidatus Methanogasteraceae archaeon]